MNLNSVKMKEKFENWLLQVGQKSGKKYKPNTITTYSRAIEKLSEHYSQQKGMQVNIYKLDCLNDYKELIIINKAYSLSGNYSIIGETGHGTYRNAIANYVRFIESFNERNTLEKKEVVDDPMENFKAVKPKYKINLFGIELFPRKEVKKTSETKKELSFYNEVLNRDPSASNAILPIELIPSDNEVFLETLLKTKKATISTFYKNGIQEDKIWNASRMTSQSNVLSILRSMGEFKNGYWQKANIVKVVVEVNSNLTSKPIYKKNIEINYTEINSIKNEETSKVTKLKIGKYVQTTFNRVISKIDAAELKNLQNAGYSKTTFDIQYPFLKKVLITDGVKIERYWKKPIELIGNKYWLCSEWYENKANNDRPHYEKWLKKIGNDNN